jgi:hypothetical protein
MGLEPGLPMTEMGERPRTCKRPNMVVSSALLRIAAILGRANVFLQPERP